ncbi:MAG: hypothetical protein L0Y57_14600 [Beijerinckiaceae bacterium]|nr:hypothetical protein [Beijerinckiaceae bacterium]
MACGRRGPLEAPPNGSAISAPLTGAPGDYQTSGPGELSGPLPANSGGQPPESQTPRPKAAPPRSFFLDPLL